VPQLPLVSVAVARVSVLPLAARPLGSVPLARARLRVVDVE
jgi:hypothetical protein